MSAGASRSSVARVTVPAHAHTAGRAWAGGRAANTNPPRDARDALGPSSPPPSAAVWPTSPADSAARPRHAQHPPWSPAGGPALEEARAMARVRPARGLEASPSLRRGGGGWGRGRGARPLYSHTHGRARRERNGGEWKNKNTLKAEQKKTAARRFAGPAVCKAPRPPLPPCRAPPPRGKLPLLRAATPTVAHTLHCYPFGRARPSPHKHAGPVALRRPAAAPPRARPACPGHPAGRGAGHVQAA